jgi:hypothetical protein
VKAFPSGISDVSDTKLDIREFTLKVYLTYEARFCTVGTPSVAMAVPRSLEHFIKLKLLGWD